MNRLGVSLLLVLLCNISTADVAEISGSVSNAPVDGVLVGSDDLRLALTASYRIGVYEEDDSPVLEGLGDRDDTLLEGFGD